MKPRNVFVALVVSTSFCLAFGCVAAQAQAPAEEDELVLRVYPVGDLLVPISYYPYRAGLPSTQSPDVTSPFGVGGMGGMGLGGMGGMGGGMGMFSVASSLPPQSSGTSGLGGGGIGGRGVPAAGAGGLGGARGGLRGPGSYPLYGSMDDVIEAITSTIAPESWEDVGGPAICVPFGSNLLIRQTPAVHEQVAELLEMIRAQGGSPQTMTVEARWLLLDSGQLGQLLPSGNSGPGPNARITVDPAILEQMTRDLPSYRGRIACFSGQTVHVVTGGRRAVVIGAVPVVGSMPAYQPIMAFVNVGVVLEATPTLLPGAEAAVLDLQSVVTGWREPEPPIQIGGSYPPSKRLSPGTNEIEEEPGGTASITVDRVNMPTQQLATTLRLPLGEPVLVGGLTLEPTESAGAEETAGEGKQLYLVVQVNAVEDQTHQAAKQNR